MNQPYDQLITVEEYFDLLKKTEELTNEEILQKKAFENFIEKCETHSEYISPATENIYADYKRKLVNLSVIEDKTPQELDLVNNFQNKMQENQEENNYTRKLDKAGYISATVMLIMLLNIGFIIAMALLK